MGSMKQFKRTWGTLNFDEIALRLYAAIIQSNQFQDKTFEEKALLARTAAEAYIEMLADATANVTPGDGHGDGSDN